MTNSLFESLQKLLTIKLYYDTFLPVVRVSSSEKKMDDICIEFRGF